MTVTLEGSVPLVCQRCLQAFEFEVDQQTMLLLWVVITAGMLAVALVLNTSGH